jgi:hypothetical protein
MAMITAGNTDGTRRRKDQRHEYGDVIAITPDNALQAKLLQIIADHRDCDDGGGKLSPGKAFSGDGGRAFASQEGDTLTVPLRAVWVHLQDVTPAQF